MWVYELALVRTQRRQVALGDIRDMSACRLGIPSLLTCYNVSEGRKWYRKNVQDSKPLPLCRRILERSHTDGCRTLERKEALETDDGFLKLSSTIREKTRASTTYQYGLPKPAATAPRDLP